MRTVDPLPGKIDEGCKVPFRREPPGREASRLAERWRRARNRLTVDDPAYRQIEAQTFGVVAIFVICKPPEYGLPQHQAMAIVPAGASASALPAITLRPRASPNSR